MERTKYIVTLMGDYPCGHRYPVIVTTTAINAEAAIEIANDAIKDDRIESTRHELISVMPESPSQAMYGDNTDGALLPCPFCGNPEPKLMDAYFNGETQYYVNCGCCNATQHPDSRERSIHDWNQRSEVGARQ